MLTMHPTLLIGPADSDATRMPQHEFLARMAKLWSAMSVFHSSQGVSRARTPNC